MRGSENRNCPGLTAVMSMVLAGESTTTMGTIKLCVIARELRSMVLMGAWLMVLLGAFVW